MKNSKAALEQIKALLPHLDARGRDLLLLHLDAAARPELTVEDLADVEDEEGDRTNW